MSLRLVGSSLADKHCLVRLFLATHVDTGTCNMQIIERNPVTAQSSTPAEALSVAPLMRVLVIDDNPYECEIYRYCVAADPEYRFDFTNSRTGAEGLALCQSEDFDCVLLDYYLPDLNGTDLIEEIEQSTCGRLPVIVLTGAGTEATAADALRSGAADYLPKCQVSTESLKRTIVNAVEKFRMKNSIKLQTQRLEKKNIDLQLKQDELLRFYHTVSHELKTPLTSIQEFASILLDGIAGELNEEQKDYLDIMLKNCHQMSNEVNDLLDATRLETGKYHIELESCQVIDIIYPVVRSLEVISQSKSIELQHVPNDKLPAVSVDPKRCRQVVTNLLSNAIKFTDDGGTVRITYSHDQESADHIRVSVVDSGCGIESDKLDLIFERLYQVETQSRVGLLTPKGGGLGLGLTIARELVELQHGKLTVVSEPGEGSEFTFTLPLDR
ncbi:MAG: ATP-binding protein [Granulosicoccus sp.]